MAYDKAVDSAQLDAGLTEIANAIRSKGGTAEQFAFPSGFTSAVQAITTGGGTNLAAVDVFIADFTDSTELTLTAGAVDKYTRTIVS